MLFQTLPTYDKTAIVYCLCSTLAPPECAKSHLLDVHVSSLAGSSISSSTVPGGISDRNPLVILPPSLERDAPISTAPVLPSTVTSWKAFTDELVHGQPAFTGKLVAVTTKGGPGLPVQPATREKAGVTLPTTLTLWPDLYAPVARHVAPWA